MHIRRFAALVCAALLAACDSASEPQGLEGSYSLNTVEGQALPIWANANGVQGSGRQLRGGTLRLREPNRVEVVLQSRLVDGAGAVEQTRADTLRGTFTREGGALRLTVQGAGLYWMGPEATITSNRQLDATLHLLSAAYTGYRDVPVAATFTR